MISLSQDYMDAIATNKAWTERVVFTLSDNSTLVATGANIWQGGISLEDTVSDSGTFEIGSTHINQATIVLYNGEWLAIEDVDFNIDTEGCLILNGEPVTYEAVYDNIDFTDAKVEVFIGLPDFTLIQKGTYIVSDYAKDDGLVTIICYDNMHKFSRVFDEDNDTAVVFPSTLGNIVSVACANCGVVLGTPNFSHYDLVISEKPSGFDSLTYREIIGYAAMISVGFARCNRQGQLEIKWFDSNASHAIQGMYDHHQGELVEITGVKLNQHYTYETSTVLDDGTVDVSSEERDVDLYHGTDDYRVSLEYNPLIEMANAQTICNWIGTAIEGMQFSIYDLTWPSDFTIEAGDVATVTDIKNQTANILVSRVTFSTGDVQSIESNAERPSQTKIVRPTNYAQGFEDLKRQLARQQTLRMQTSADIAESAEDAKKVADNYVSADSTGVMVADMRDGEQTPSTATGRNVLITSEDFQVRQGQKTEAIYGREVILGRSDGNKVVLGPNQIAMRDSSNVDVFKMVPSAAQTETITEESGDLLPKANGSIYFSLSHVPIENSTVEITFQAYNGDDLDGQDFSTTVTYVSGNLEQIPFAIVEERGGQTVTLYDCTLDWSSDISGTIPPTMSLESDPVLTKGSFTVTYQTTTYSPPAFTFGTRVSGSTEGRYSVALGMENEASGDTAFAEGHRCEASGILSHAEGSGSIASGNSSHAEGANTEAGTLAHAEGSGSIASGYISHAQGMYTIASSDYQMAMGKYNKEDANDKYSLIIGNGEGDYARKNALAVTWDGDVLNGLETLNLGTYIASAVLTGGAGNLQFSIPTGRVFPSGTTITIITFDIIGRSANANGTGYYIIKSSAGGYNAASFNSSVPSTFYNAADDQKTLTTALWTSKSIQGGTNIYISLGDNTTDFFSGNATIRNYINNNPVVLYLSNIQVILSNPFQN